ncbi:hypothetical protein [Amycolatopsis sp. NBC_01480]|uniref:hypothetical protein n=1 Tax=Amycolatopsis sp. NBC_01480 TaxID=2903562 RepID=UPI002E2E0F3F|nr:hypothetical protein [Amycolatopsis sp. NBC_01480]
MLHHVFTEQFVHDRQAELHTAARRRHRPHRRPPKERLGWFLVETGLRLTARPAH